MSDPREEIFNVLKETFDEFPKGIKTPVFEEDIIEDIESFSEEEEQELLDALEERDTAEAIMSQEALEGLHSLGKYIDKLFITGSKNYYRVKKWANLIAVKESIAGPGGPLERCIKDMGADLGS